MTSAPRAWMTIPFRVWVVGLGVWGILGHHASPRMTSAPGASTQTCKIGYLRASKSHLELGVALVKLHNLGGADKGKVLWAGEKWKSRSCTDNFAHAGTKSGRGRVTSQPDNGMLPSGMLACQFLGAWASALISIEKKGSRVCARRVICGKGDVHQRVEEEDDPLSLGPDELVRGELDELVVENGGAAPLGRGLANLSTFAA